MDYFYLFIVIILFSLAILDLVVGVSNDAVNFLNSAIGSRVASYRVILIIAAGGILSGALFSSGMMEVARKGIFHPQYFYFNEIMTIFLAVMITDVIMLDLFNTFGMPTSTTVSIVFDILGAALAISVIKISTQPDALTIAEYINTSKALAIISAILLSVIVAFISGVIIQYLVRLTFSFDYVKRLNYLGSIFGGIAITAITYFMLIKGLKGSPFADNIMSNGEPLKEWIKHQVWDIVLYSFLGWTVVIQILRWVFRINILKIIVFFGTFALAMAFAGNDLVNFIGVPLAGFESFKQFIHQSEFTDTAFKMVGLSGKVKTPIYFLLLSGVIMVLTLWFSKKAKDVVKTAVDLSRQDEGDEKFGSSPIARGIIKQTVAATEFLNRVLPGKITAMIRKQFDQTEYNKKMKQLGDKAPAFDMLRASVNLIVASILISYATSYKLPLSTTYVTFMVAMGTSLADRAWGRESAVYRITGVLTVILGWFFTALIAMTASFIVAYFLYYAGVFGLAVMLIILILLVIKTGKIHKRRTDVEKSLKSQEENIVNLGVIESCKIEILQSLDDFDRVIRGVFNSLFVENGKQLKRFNKEVEDLNKSAKKLKKDMHKTVSKIKEDSEEAGHYYIQILDFLREMAHSLEFISQPALDHVENKHKSLIPEQIEELRALKDNLCALINMVKEIIKTSDYEKVDEAIKLTEDISKQIATMRKLQVKRIKNEQASTKASILYFSIIHEAKNFTFHTINLLKSHRDFILKR
jgi:phosphate/sulfate permease